MLAFYELGGWTPTPLARLAQASGWIAVLAWSVSQVLMVTGVVAFDYRHAATGVFAIQCVALVVIGLWVAGANLLAGPWLSWVRWLGVLSGLGCVGLAIGLLLGGMDHPLTYLGGIGYGSSFRSGPSSWRACWWDLRSHRNFHGYRWARSLVGHPNLPVGILAADQPVAEGPQVAAANLQPLAIGEVPVRVHSDAPRSPATKWSSP